MHKCAYTTAVSCEWDPSKAKANFKKHGFHFADAVAALEDEFALTIRDLWSEPGERWITLGQDAINRVLIVIYTWREDRNPINFRTSCYVT